MRPALPLTDAPAPLLYRPRHPERAPTYRVLERHFDDYVHAHEEGFEERHGSLRRAVPRSVARYLECGRLMGGFAHIRCPDLSPGNRSGVMRVFQPQTGHEEALDGTEAEPSGADRREAA